MGTDRWNGWTLMDGTDGAKLIISALMISVISSLSNADYRL
ncbi:unnamed protein product, partial [Staurois parvus]